MTINDLLRQRVRRQGLPTHPVAARHPSRGDLLQSMTLKEIHCGRTTPRSREKSPLEGCPIGRGGSVT